MKAHKLVLYEIQTFDLSAYSSFKNYQDYLFAVRSTIDCP